MYKYLAYVGTYILGPVMRQSHCSSVAMRMHLSSQRTVKELRGENELKLAILVDYQGHPMSTVRVKIKLCIHRNIQYNNRLSCVWTYGTTHQCPIDLWHYTSVSYLRMAPHIGVLLTYGTTHQCPIYVWHYTSVSY